LRGPLSQRWLAAAAVAVAVLLQAPVAHAGPCLPISQPLLKIPELVRNDHTKVLRGTMLLTDEQQRLIIRSPGATPGQPGSFFDCQPQHVRAFQGIEALPKVPLSPGGIIDPVPGPTLRARLGDVIEITFLNQIDPNRFPYSIDQGEKRGPSGSVQDPAAGCDTSNPSDPGKKGYPLSIGDKFPDCFHGSSTGNIHFHGTHTNPNGTGDNVLLEIRPSPLDASKKPLVTADSVKKPFTDFFTACEASLRADVLSPYPQNWDEKPLGPWTTAGTWTAEQAKLLQAYDARTKEDLWGANKKVIDLKPPAWPQYYIGAYPYCFRIPEYKETTWPPSSGVRMGQSPGTHWYHAHKHGSTAINVSNGMTGVFIIEGPYDDDLNAFYGPGWTRKQPVIVINQLGVSPNLMRSGGFGRQDKGYEFMVNGRFQPVIDMAPGEVQLWRMANTSGRSGAYFGNFAPGIQWMQIAQDGVQFADNNYQASKNQPFLLAAGNRADLLVKAPASPGTYPVLVKHDVDPSDLPSAFPVVLMQIRVRSDVPPATGNRLKFIPAAPAQPKFLTNITDAEVANQAGRPRVVKFASTGPGQGASHTINGHKFEDGDTPIAVTLDAVEEWKIVNETYGPAISHPFHIHINPFQIVEVFDPNATVTVRNVGVVPKYVFDGSALQSAALQCSVDPKDEITWKDCHNDTSDAPRIWWDVFPIPSGAQPTVNGTQYNIPGSFLMRSRFVDFAGQYVLHCHILAHEDRGMMTIVQVSAPNKPIPQARYMHH
jgi:FtsP/CotA-like multicopper oxidase with cupredoxin domain